MTVSFVICLGYRENVYVILSVHDLIIYLFAEIMIFCALTSLHILAFGEAFFQSI